MLYAFVEGLVGVQDKLKEFKSIRFTPRWEAAGVKNVEALIEYPASGAYIKYNYLSSYKSVKLEIEGTPEAIDLELYLPENRKSVSVNITGGDIQTINENKPEDQYFRCSIKKYSHLVKLTILLSGK
jgi:hypothetical protein